LFLGVHKTNRTEQNETKPNHTKPYKTKPNKKQPTQPSGNMNIETYFATLTVGVEDDNNSFPHYSSSPSERRKKRRLNAPAAMSELPPNEMKRSSFGRQQQLQQQIQLRQSHHGGDRLKDFYGEIAPDLIKRRRRSISRVSSNDDDDCQSLTVKMCNASWLAATRDYDEVKPITVLRSSCFREIVHGVHDSL
jgi:hypothetical protein